MKKLLTLLTMITGGTLAGGGVEAFTIAQTVHNQHQSDSFNADMQKLRKMERSQDVSDLTMPNYSVTPSSRYDYQHTYHKKRYGDSNYTKEVSPILFSIPIKNINKGANSLSDLQKMGYSYIDLNFNGYIQDTDDKHEGSWLGRYENSGGSGPRKFTLSLSNFSTTLKSTGSGEHSDGPQKGYDNSEYHHNEVWFHAYYKYNPSSNSLEMGVGFFYRTRSSNSRYASGGAKIVNNAFTVYGGKNYISSNKTKFTNEMNKGISIPLSEWNNEPLSWTDRKRKIYKEDGKEYYIPNTEYYVHKGKILKNRDFDPKSYSSWNIDKTSITLENLIKPKIDKLVKNTISNLKQGDLYWKAVDNIEVDYSLASFKNEKITMPITIYFNSASRVQPWKISYFTISFDSKGISNIEQNSNTFSKFEDFKSTAGFGTLNERISELSAGEGIEKDVWHYGSNPVESYVLKTKTNDEGEEVLIPNKPYVKDEHGNNISNPDYIYSKYRDDAAMGGDVLTFVPDVSIKTFRKWGFSDSQIKEHQIQDPQNPNKIIWAPITLGEVLSVQLEKRVTNSLKQAFGDVYNDFITSDKIKSILPVNSDWKDSASSNELKYNLSLKTIDTLKTKLHLTSDQLNSLTTTYTWLFDNSRYQKLVSDWSSINTAEAIMDKLKFDGGLVYDGDQNLIKDMPLITDTPIVDGGEGDVEQTITMPKKIFRTSLKFSYQTTNKVENDVATSEEVFIDGDLGQTTHDGMVKSLITQTDATKELSTTIKVHQSKKRRIKGTNNWELIKDTTIIQPIHINQTFVDTNILSNNWNPSMDEGATDEQIRQYKLITQKLPDPDHPGSEIDNPDYDPTIDPATGTKKQLVWVSLPKNKIPSSFLNDPLDSSGESLVDKNGKLKPGQDYDYGFIAEAIVSDADAQRTILFPKNTGDQEYKVAQQSIGTLNNINLDSLTTGNIGEVFPSDNPSGSVGKQNVFLYTSQVSSQGATPNPDYDQNNPLSKEYSPVDVYSSGYKIAISDERGTGKQFLDIPAVGDNGHFTSLFSKYNPITQTATGGSTQGQHLANYIRKNTEEESLDSIPYNKILKYWSEYVYQTQSGNIKYVDDHQYNLGIIEENKFGIYEEDKNALETEVKKKLQTLFNQYIIPGNGKTQPVEGRDYVITSSSLSTGANGKNIAELTPDEWQSLFDQYWNGEEIGFKFVALETEDLVMEGESKKISFYKDVNSPLNLVLMRSEFLSKIGGEVNLSASNLTNTPKALVDYYIKSVQMIIDSNTESTIEIDNNRHKYLFGKQYDVILSINGKEISLKESISEQDIKLIEEVLLADDSPTHFFVNIKAIDKYDKEYPVIGSVKVGVTNSTAGYIPTPPTIETINFSNLPIISDERLKYKPETTPEEVKSDIKTIINKWMFKYVKNFRDINIGVNYEILVNSVDIYSSEATDMIQAFIDNPIKEDLDWEEIDENDLALLDISVVASQNQAKTEGSTSFEILNDYVNGEDPSTINLDSINTDTIWKKPTDFKDKDEFEQFVNGIITELRNNSGHKRKVDYDYKTPPFKKGQVDLRGNKELLILVKATSSSNLIKGQFYIKITNEDKPGPNLDAKDLSYILKDISFDTSYTEKSAYKVIVSTINEEFPYLSNGKDYEIKYFSDPNSQVKTWSSYNVTNNKLPLNAKIVVTAKPVPNSPIKGSATLIVGYTPNQEKTIFDLSTMLNNKDLWKILPESLTYDELLELKNSNITTSEFWNDLMTELSIQINYYFEKEGISVKPFNENDLTKLLESNSKIVVSNSKGENVEYSLEEFNKLAIEEFNYEEGMNINIILISDESNNTDEIGELKLIGKTSSPKITISNDEKDNNKILGNLTKKDLAWLIPLIVFGAAGIGYLIYVLVKKMKHTKIK